MELEHFSEYAIIKNSVAGDTTTGGATTDGAITGDTTNIWCWLGLLTIAAIAVGSMSVLKKTYRRYEYED